jgi:signal transduction histidine kinase
VDPRRIPANDRPPPVKIERVTIDDEEVSPDDSLTLAPAARDLEIDYTALSLTIPERNQFRYMLEGRETEWHEAGTRRQAVYTDLPPKTYRFRVVASNNDGIWNETGAVWSFRVLPAWYQTLWFRTLVVLLIGGLGAVVAVTVQRSRHRREQQALTVRYESTLAERSRIAQELHDTLLQGFTGITLQLRGIQRQLGQRPESGASALNDVLATADIALQDARHMIWDMRAVELEGRELADALESAALSAVAGSNISLVFTARGNRRPLPLSVETTVQS